MFVPCINTNKTDNISGVTDPSLFDQSCDVDQDCMTEKMAMSAGAIVHMLTSMCQRLMLGMNIIRSKETTVILLVVMIVLPALTKKRSV